MDIIYYLLFREEYSGPVKNGYRAAFKALGYGDNEADIFYNVVDLSLFGASLLKPVLKEDTWKLFHYIKSDFITSWKTMDRVPLISEIFLTVWLFILHTIYMKRKIKVNNFDVLSPFPLGWLGIFLFYLSSLFLFFILYKTQLYILCKKIDF
ncbi:DUF4225 domain-containing protein [Proteus sp. G2669]|uniref:DUF4225 domain-containing protein n=1 Tax=Proteus sp. G2669 TaxID=2698881 RepID=UPI0014126A9F|nr:DUF4225 domain-containing protein [Proteus sp. G2669]NBM53223.1 DUF4225 domain-containing protein [Proteus sp. G2669]